MNNLKPHKTLRTISYKQANKKRTKFIALMILVIILISSVMPTAFASTTQVNFGDWIDTSYYQRAYDHSGWSNLRIEAFDTAFRLVQSYNDYTKFNTKKKENVVKMVNELCSDKLNENNDYNRQIGEELKKHWASLGNDILSIDSMTHTYCAKGNGIPVLDDSDTKVKNSDYTDLISKCRDSQKTMNEIVKQVKKYYETSSFDANSSASKFSNSIFNLVGKCWKYLGTLLKTWGTGSSSTSNFLGIGWTTNSMKSIANSVSGITKTFAYCIAIILFGLNLQNTMLQFEITTLKGVLKIFAGLLIGKVWIDVSINVCAYILNIVNSLNKQIFSALYTNATALELKDTFTYNSKVDENWWDFIGVIINYFENILWHLPEYALGIFVCISIISVMIKLVVRNFELTALMCIAPLAFSTIVNNETKVYFKKFIGAFISTAMYATFMVICFIVGSQWLSELNQPLGSTSFASSITSILPKTIIIVGICRIMRKPPKVLTSLIE